MTHDRIELRHFPQFEGRKEQSETIFWTQTTAYRCVMTREVIRISPTKATSYQQQEDAFYSDTYDRRPSLTWEIPSPQQEKLYTHAHVYIYIRRYSMPISIHYTIHVVVFSHNNTSTRNMFGTQATLFLPCTVLLLNLLLSSQVSGRNIDRKGKCYASVI